MENIQAYLFYIFAAMAVLSALLVVANPFSRNPGDGLLPLNVCRRVATTQIGLVKSTFAIPAREAMPNDSTTLGASAPARLETKNERSRL